MIDLPVERYLRDHGEVYQVFRHQDSGTVSYGVLVDSERWFVKPSDDPSIVKSLRRAIHLHTTVRHPALPRFHNSFTTPGGLALVYGWVPGEVLNDPRYTSDQRRHDPAHPHVRFRSLLVPTILDVLDDIYDFEGGGTFLCDLDEYRHGPFVLEMDRNYGSTRFMAPEEFQRGAIIDQVTNVFTLGRAATVLLGDGTASLDAWRGTDLMKEVVMRATDPERARRHQSVPEYVEQWRAAVGR